MSWASTMGAVHSDYRFREAMLPSGIARMSPVEPEIIEMLKGIPHRNPGFAGIRYRHPQNAGSRCNQG
jgi:hypothetical protein